MNTRPPFVSVDYRTLLGLAEKSELPVEAVRKLKQSMPGVVLMVTEATLAVLQEGFPDGSKLEDRIAARTALRDLSTAWKMKTPELAPDKRDRRLRLQQAMWDAGLVVHGDTNTARLLAEAALLNCSIVLAQNAALCDERLRERVGPFLVRQNLAAPRLMTPREVLMAG